jgi:hypothetical protein
MATPSKEPRKHPGSCHCGAVRFEVEVDASSGGACNCSICTKIGGIAALVKPAAFRLLSGESSLSFYEWGSKTAKRYFCKSCGVTCFSRGHLAEVGGDYVSVNLNALDDVDPAHVKVGYWDGRHNNWEGGQRSEPWPIFV